MLKKGRVYWITGLSGSGKTTIGTALYYDLRQTQDNVIILDGDILKMFMGDSVGYRPEDRLARGRKYSQLCKVLSEQGMCVIICTVAMFDEIREWNRANIKEYIEVFLDVPFETLSRRNKKGLYDDPAARVAYEKAEFPKTPDIRLLTDGSEDVESCVVRIKALDPRVTDDFNRDSAYWDGYYGRRPQEIEEPSMFASWVAKQLPLEADILDLGCGNGRDSLFFISCGFHVTGIDASRVAIHQLKKWSNVSGGGDILVSLRRFCEESHALPAPLRCDLQPFHVACNHARSANGTPAKSARCTLAGRAALYRGAQHTRRTLRKGRACCGACLRVQQPLPTISGACRTASRDGVSGLSHPASGGGERLFQDTGLRSRPAPSCGGIRELRRSFRLPLSLLSSSLETEVA